MYQYSSHSSPNFRLKEITNGISPEFAHPPRDPSIDQAVLLQSHSPSSSVYRLGCQRSALLAFNPIHQVFIILWIWASKKRRSSSSEGVFSVVVHKLMQTHFQSFHRTFGKRNVNFLYQRHESPILCSRIQKKGHK